MNLLDEPFQLYYQYPAWPSLPFLRWVSAEMEDGSGPSHSILCPGRGSSLSGWFGWCPWCCQYITGCLEAAARFLRRASQGCSSAPSLPWSFRGKESLDYFAGWSVCCCFGVVPVYLSGWQLCKFCPGHPRGTYPSPWHVFSAHVALVFARISSELWAFQIPAELNSILLNYYIMLLCATGTSLNKSPESLGLSRAVRQARCCSQGPPRTL